MRHPNKEEQLELRPMATALDDLDEQLAICQAQWQRQIKRLQVACGVPSSVFLDPVTLQWVRLEQQPGGKPTAVPFKTEE